jgi:HAD-hyrolase-like
VPSGELDHKPELLAHILSKHGLSPSRSLMVGDRRYDISGAHAVGMRGLGVLWGYGTRDELETAGADQLVDSPADLARTVLSMVNGAIPRLGSYIQASSLISAPGTSEAWRGTRMKAAFSPGA